MKKYCILLALILLLPLAAIADSYTKQWKAVEKAINDDMPKTALKAIDNIIANAQKQNNQAELIKAYITRLSIAEELSSDSATAVLPKVESIAKAQTNPADKSVWYMVVGWMYAKRDHYLYNDTKQRALEAFRIATADPQLLANTPSKNYMPILDKGEGSSYYKDDMLSVIFPFVARQLRQLGTVEGDDNSKDVMHKEIAYYQTHGNREATLLAKIDSTSITGYENTDFYNKLLEDYKDLPLVTEVCVWLSQHKDSKEAYELINKTLEKYPKTIQTNTLKNQLSTITQPVIRCTLQNALTYPGDVAKIILNHRNTSEATITYARLPYAASDTILEKMRGKDYDRFFNAPDYKQKVLFQENLAYDFSQDTISLQMPQSGIYVVRIVSPEAGNDYAVLEVSRLSIMQLPMPKKKVRICVVDYKTGAAVANAHLRLRFEEKKAVTWKDCDTDSNGEFVMDSPKGNCSIFASTATDKALGGYDLAHSYDYNWNRTDRDTNIQIYTDRAIYRPGQNVKVAGFLFSKDGDSTSALKRISIDIKLRNANGKELEKANVYTDEFGAFGAEFTLPQSGLNGNYSIQTNYGTKYFKVEEYKRPKFKVTINDPDVAYTLGDTIILKGEVKTYSGLPLANTKVYCSSKREKSWWFYSSENEATTTVYDTISTDAEGRFEMPVVLSYSGSSISKYHWTFYTYTINAKATAEDGETEEASTHLYAGNTKTIVTTNIPELICKEEMGAIKATQNNCMGTPVDGKGRYFIVQNKDTIQRGDIEFNQDGQLDFISNLPSGEYKIVISPTDETNEYLFYNHYFTIFSLNDTKPATYSKLYTWSNSNSFKLDEPVSVLMGTSLSDAWVHYDLMANEQVIESRVFHVSDSIIRLNYTYKPEYGQGVYIQFALYKDGTLYRRSVVIEKAKPEKQLEVKWTTFRDKLQPGAKEKWTMQISKNDKPVSASVLATMYDCSLDKFGKHSLPFGLSFPRTIPYLNWQGATRYEKSLSACKRLNMLEEQVLTFTLPSDMLFSPFRFSMMNETMVYAGAKAPRVFKQAAHEAGLVFESADDALKGQIAGLEQEEDLTANVELRTDFNETAFFASSIKTNANGEAFIEFKLPESITSWNFQALAHTANMDYGFLNSTIMVEKPFTVQANMPRFLRSSDKTMLAVNISNNTDKTQSGKAQLALIDAQTGKQIKLLTQTFNVNAKQSKVVSFPVEGSTDTPLLICKYVAVSKDFSDGEQQYLPVLADLQETITTVPFTLTDTNVHEFLLNDLDFQPNAVKSTLSVEYMGNPAWTAIEALPSVVDYKSRCATSLGINYSALTIMRQIIKENPQIQTLIDKWKENPEEETPLLALENNEELKQLLLSETPWVSNADSERKRFEGLMQDDMTLTLKQASMLDKLKEMQTASGGWQWFPGMQPSLWLTMDIVEMLVRTRNLCPDYASQINPLVNKGIAYLDNQAAQEVKYLKENKAKTIPTLWMRYLYVTAIGDWEQTPTRKYLLNRLAESATDYDLYDKAMAACILKATGKDKEAQATIKSLKEYLISKPGMGQFFDGKKAPMSWNMYRIPTQVAAIEAINAVTPEDKTTIADMKLWLIQSKHAQGWNSPLAATQAIQCLLSTQMLAAPTAVPAKLNLTTSRNKTININEIGTTNPFVQMGYVKASMPTKDLGAAPKAITVQQSAATIEQPLSYGAVYLQNYMPSSEIKAAGSELSLTMQVQKQVANGWEVIPSGSTLKKGDRIKVRYEITATRDLDFVGLKDGRAACMEPTSTASGYQWGYYRSVEDASTIWFFDHISKGKHVVEETYDIDRVGTFSTACPQVQCQYAPEFTARTRNFTIKVE